MITAEIKYDETNRLGVEIEHGDTTEYLFDENNILSFFYTIDKIKYRSIRIHKNALILVSDDEEVIIRDIARFSNENWFQKLPSIAKQTKKVIVKYNRQEAKKKTKKNGKLNGKKVVATGIVLTVLIVTSAITNSINHDYANEEEVDDIDIDIDNLKALGIFENVANKINNLNEKINETQDTVEYEDTSLMDYTGSRAYLDYVLSSDMEKREYAYNNFYPIVETYAPKWGISNNLIMSMLTQETGGYNTNLMQIDFEVWKEKEIKVYNFKDNRYDHFVLTNNPEEYAGQRVTCITEEDLKNPITNISIGCVLLRKSAEYMDYHVLAAIQCYNLGKGNMDAVLAKTMEETGQTREEILSDQENISFYQFTNVIKEGDPKYLSNIFAFLSDYGEVITFKHFGENNEIVEERISIFSNQQTNGYH